MSDELYSVLGLERTASDEEIRKAYRKRVRELHPDLNPGDPGAEEKFKKVSAAFDILGDAEKRARYDRGEIDAQGEERAQQSYYRQHAGTERGARYHSTAGFEDFGDASDLFGQFFGGRGRAVHMRGQDRRYHLDVDFRDAVQGATRRLTMPDGGTLDVTIPAGIRSGATLRLKGKGGPGMGEGPPGDALVEVEVRPHPVFTREGDDILLDLPITIDEAVLGGKVEVPTLSGRVAMTVPAGSSGGDVLRLRKKGVAPKGRAPGDQRVTLQIVLPEEIDPDLARCIETWRETHGYDPRTHLRRF